MRAVIGPITLDDGRSDPAAGSEPPAFPNGVTLHIFDHWGQAQPLLGERFPGTGHLSKDGRIMVGTVKSYPDAFLGLEPKAIIDHSSQPWPPAFRQMLDWRASRARIEIQRPE